MSIFSKDRERITDLKIRWVKRNRKYQVKGQYWCAYCGKWVAYEDMHVDHIIPFSKGGPNKDSNLVPSCASCNLSKSAKMSVFYYASGKTYSLRFWIERIISMVSKWYLLLAGGYFTVIYLIPETIHTYEGKVFLSAMLLFAFWKLDMNILLFRVFDKWVKKLWHVAVVFLSFAVIAFIIVAVVMSGAVDFISGL